MIEMISLPLIGINQRFQKVSFFYAPNGKKLSSRGWQYAFSLYHGTRNQMLPMILGALARPPDKCCKQAYPMAVPSRSRGCTHRKAEANIHKKSISNNTLACLAPACCVRSPVAPPWRQTVPSRRTGGGCGGALGHKLFYIGVCGGEIQTYDFR